jgi:hypothetical protein
LWEENSWDTSDFVLAPSNKSGIISKNRKSSDQVGVFSRVINKWKKWMAMGKVMAIQNPKNNRFFILIYFFK